MAREFANAGQPLQCRALANDDEVPALQVLGRPGATAGIEDRMQVVLGKWRSGEITYGPNSVDGLFDVHCPSLDFGRGQGR